MLMRSLRILSILLLFIFNNSSSIAYSPLPFKFIVGEIKGMKGTYKGYQQILNQTEFGFKYDFILEKSASQCYFINRYILNIDTTCLKYLNSSNADELEFYNSIRINNLSREFNKKVRVRSFDLEYQQNFSIAVNALHYMISMVSNKALQLKADSIYSDSIKPNFIKAKDLTRIIDSTRISDLLTDDSVYQQIKKNLYLTIELGEPFTKSWYKNREKILLIEFQNSILGIDRYCAIVNNNHLPEIKHSNGFLKYFELNELGIKCYYPIYINRFSNNELKKAFVCGHKKNPFKWNKKTLNVFTKKSGAWLMSNKKTNYFVVSN